MRNKVLSKKHYYNTITGIKKGDILSVLYNDKLILNDYEFQNDIDITHFEITELVNEYGNAVNLLMDNRTQDINNDSFVEKIVGKIKQKIENKCQNK